MINKDIIKEYKRRGYPIPKKKLIRREKEIQKIRESADITREILDLLEDKLYIGMKTSEIDKIVYDYTISRGAVPATLGYMGYEYSCCISRNDIVCHGMPSDEECLEDGDIVNIDISTDLNGYFSDASRMYKIGKVSEKAEKLVDCTKEALNRAIEAIKPYKTIGEVGMAIEPYAISMGYSVVEDFIGHGVGLKFHDEPDVYHFATGEKEMVLVPGMIFTIEPMLNEESFEVKILEDGWTVVTKDGGLSAQWEHTVLVTETSVEILT